MFITRRLIYYIIQLTYTKKKSKKNLQMLVVLKFSKTEFKISANQVYFQFYLTGNLASVFLRHFILIKQILIESFHVQI